MRLAANISLLYSDLPVAERFAAAARDGFRYVEILAPYDESAKWYAQQLNQHNLQLVLINTPAAPPAYPVGMAAQPQAREQFQAAMERAAEVCTATGCKAVHVMAGHAGASDARRAQSDVLKENLDWATKRYPDFVLHLEALNKTDMPDYFYSVPSQVAKELANVDSPNVGMQFDFYHVAKEGLAIEAELTRYFPVVRHVQVAGAPDRHEPVLARDNLLAGFKLLHALGYTGYVGLEYRPAQTARQGLSWVQPLLDQELVRM